MDEESERELQREGNTAPVEGRRNRKEEELREEGKSHLGLLEFACDHVLDETIEYTLHLEQEGRAVAFLGLSAKLVLGGIATSRACKSVEGVQAVHLARRLQSLVRAIDNRDQFRVVLQVSIDASTNAA
jgi:hypothetical protein